MTYLKLFLRRLLVVFGTCFSAATLSACAGSPRVATPAQAIELGKRLCGYLIPTNRVSNGWSAVIDDGHEVGWNIPNGVWRVGTEFDDSHGNVMS